MLEKTTKINMLYDFYEVLLTDKQKSYMEMYYLEDYSLGEIAELSHVSRQAVYDTIKRTEQLLISYEDKLLLYDKFKKRTSLLEELEKTLQQQGSHKAARTILDQIEKID